MPTSGSFPLTSREQIHGLMKVALGEAEADLAIVSGDIANVYTGELLTGKTVLIKGDRIAYVGENGDSSIGSATKVIDATGKTLIPGLIDGHTHTDSLCPPGEQVSYMMRGGTTTIISEVSNLVFLMGYQGFTQYLEAAKDQPIKIFATVPPMITISPTAEEHAIGVLQLRNLLRRREVVGLGETFWAPVIANNQRVLNLIAETIEAGKRVDGHSAGARGNKLQAYVASGVSSCHEPITAAEVKERLRLGLFTLIREGEVRADLEAIAKIKDENIDLSQLGLATDGISPAQLISDGHMECLVQKAIDLGFDPITAIKMATINVAQHFAIDDLVGGIAPGKCADIVIIPNLRTIRAEYVVSDGRLIARDRQPLVESRKHTYPVSMRGSIRLTRDLTAEDFAVPVDASQKQVKVRVIDLVTKLITKEAIVNVPITDGRLGINVKADLLKVAAIERTYVPGKTFVGFIRGLNIKRGAIAGSIAWDISDIIVAGASEADMAQAVNRVRQLQGGLVVCADGQILAEIALPLAGIISEQPLETIARELTHIQQAAADLGFPYPDVRTTLGVLTTPAIPFLRICEAGLFSIAQNSFVDLMVD